MTEDLIPPSVDENALERSRFRLGKWQVIFLVVAALLMGTGLALGAMAPDRPETTPQSAHPSDGAAAASGSLPGVDLSLAPTDPDNPTAGNESPADPSGMEAWSPTIFRMGFSFFVGFAIAYAIRSFIKLTVIAAGLFLLLLFGLQYVNVIDVNWARMEQFYDGALAWLGTQTSSFTTFIQSFLPSSAMAGFGAVMGFRKK